METTSIKRTWMARRALLLVCCLLLAAAQGRAATIYFADDFEEGLGKWTVGGDTWQATDAIHHGGQYAVSDSPDGDYPLNANSIMAMKLQYRVDLSDSNSPILSFWHQISVEEGDYGYVEISQDNGFNWEEVASFTNTWRSTWSREMVDLAAFKMSPILIRFRLRDDGRTGSFSRPIVSFGWDIDDVMIQEMDQETLPFPLFDDFETGTGNWVFGGWQSSESYSRSSTHSMADSNDSDYPKDAFSDLILAHAIDLSSTMFPVLSFWHRIGVEDGDHARVEISEDGGWTWHSVDPNQPDIADWTDAWYSGWTPELFDLSAYRSSKILIRFHLRDDGRTGSFSRPIVSSGWDIDDVEVKELLPPELYVEMTALTAANCPTVQATVIVADANGNPVMGLPESAFSVFEDGALQDAMVIESNNQTVAAGLTLDFSGSMGVEAIADLRLAAEKFVGSMRSGDSFEIIKFANGIDVAQPYTDDPCALTAAIWTEPNVTSSQTVFYDAVEQAILDTVAQEGFDSRAIVAMTDGQDNFSTHSSASAVIDLAQRNGVRVFTIGLGDQVDEDALSAIATLTGGVYYHAPGSEDLEAIYDAVAGSIKNQYIITYDTRSCGSDTVQSEHEVMIAVSAPAGFGLDTERFECPTECNLE